jgi:Na+/proline symporter
MLASKTEKDALGGTLLFNAAHYALRPWPWIIVALASMLVYPTVADIARTFPNVDPALLGHDLAYPAMFRFLPAGWLGLMVAGLLAAYVSTLSTHLNWGGSYLVHDFYRRFLRSGAADKHYVLVGRITTVLLMVAAAFLTLVLDTAKASFDLLLSIGAGTGLLYLLRWFWWRINAWSEVAAMVSSFLVAVGFFVAGKMGHPVPGHVSLLTTIAVTTVAWVATTLLTAPTERSVLVNFYKLVRPAGGGWGTVAAEAGVGPSPDSIPQQLLGWVLGIGCVYGALFGAGSFLFGATTQGWVWTAVFVVCGVGLLRVVPRMWK